MTRRQNLLIAVVSLLATAAILVAGRSSAPSPADLGRAVADRKPVTVAGPASAAPASEDTSSDDSNADAAASDDTSSSSDTAGTSRSSTASDDGTSDGSGGSGQGEGGDDAKPATAEPTKIEHVFVIALAGHGFDATFGSGSPATYLNGQLRPKGTLLSGYRALGAADLPDALAMVGGQPPNAATNAGCTTYTEIPPSAKVSKSGEVDADGCVYPNTVTTLGDQLSASRRSWRAYVEDLEKGPDAKATCRHPESNAPDDTTVSRAGDGYATRHNPFVYFHSLLDLGDCDADDGGLTQLDADLGSIAKTPNLSFIVPNLCNDGTESPCAADGSPGGLAAADAFLATWAPKILASPAYRKDGLLVVTFAGQVVAAGAPAPTDAALRNGTLLVSRFATAGGTAASTYEPYSLLRSVEDLFALKPLARAAKAASFAPTVLGKAYATPPSDG